MLSRRRFTQLAGLAAASVAAPGRSAFGAQQEARGAADITLNIEPFEAEPTPSTSTRRSLTTGRFRDLRMQQGRPVTVQINNRTARPDLVHWYGLFLPPATDGAMEEGTPMIPPGCFTVISRTTWTAGS